MTKEYPSDAEINEAIDALAEKAKRGIYGTSGHAWSAIATIDRDAALLKAALADANNGKKGGEAE